VFQYRNYGHITENIDPIPKPRSGVSPTVSCTQLLTGYHLPCLKDIPVH